MNATKRSVSLHASLVVGSLFLLSFLTPAASAQSSTGNVPVENAKPGSTGNDETVKMSPFDVTASPANDYRAVDALTSSGIATKLIDSPQNISVVTEAFIRDLNLDSMEKTLLYTSGVQIDQYNRDASGVLLRGFGISAFLRDGVARSVNAVTEDIDRVEVVKGPDSAFFSQSNPGGIVNYITKKPEFIDKGSLNLTYGSYNYRTALLDYQANILPQSKTLAFRVVAGFRRTQNWREFEYVHRKYLAPSIRWRPNKYLDVNYEYEYVESNENLLDNGRTNPQFHVDWANPPSDVIEFNRAKHGPSDANVIAYLQNRWNRSITNWATDIQAVRGGLAPFVVTTGNLESFYPEGRTYNTGGSGANHLFTSHSNNVTVTLTPVSWLVARYNYNYFNGYTDQYQPFGFPNGDRTMPYAQRSSVAWQTAASNSLDILITKSIGPVNNRFLFGAQRLWGTSQSSAHTFDYSRLAPVVHNGVTLTGADVANFYNPFTDPPIDVQQIMGPIVAPKPASGSGSFGKYAQWQSDFWRFHTQIGVRKEEQIGGNKYPVTPTYGVNFTLTPGFVLYGSYSENFKVNSFNINGAGVLPGEQVLLPPAYAKGKEIGFKTNWRDNTLTGTFSLFSLTNSGIAFTDAQRNLTDPRNTDNISTNNVVWDSAGGVWKTEGTELELMWTPSSNFQIQFAWDNMWQAQILTAPQYAPGTPEYNFEIGRRLSNDPHTSIKIWEKYTFRNSALRGLSVGLGGRYVGQTIGGNASVTSQFFYVDPYTVFDLMLGYSLRGVMKEPININLTVSNLANHIYLQGANDIFADPRKIYLSTTLHF